MNVHRRLQALERKQNHGDGVLILPGGATLVLQVRDWLGLVLAAFGRNHARAYALPLPQTVFDRTLDRIEGAVGIGPGSPPLLEVAWDALQGPHELAPEDDFDFNSTTIN